jgi:nitroimidazol reductase NimA-like FMN-containing flavoprotein (pyridoxamine 5'-phosphate oxidase superfamily)
MPDEDVKRVLKDNSHGVLATVSEDGTPYAVPVSYVYYEGCVYFHSAAEGHKVDNIAGNDNVCFTIIGNVLMKGVPKSDAFFESVIVFGKAVRVDEVSAQLGPMTEFMRAFMPDKVHETENDLINMHKALIVYRIDIEHISGKLRKPQKK